MKNIKINYFILFLVSTIAFSCKNQDVSIATTIKYGTSFGMCAGYCKRDLVLNNKQATLSLNKHGSNPETKSCNKEVDDATLSSINESIDANTFNNMPDVIGCPDCADGGAEYVELTNNGKTKRVTFEYGKTPTELKELLNQIKPIFNSFNDCK